MTTLPKVLLFDLGGVIVPWVGLERLSERHNLTRDAVAERFAASQVFMDYQRGEASDAVFLAELQTLFDLPETDIAALWNSWVEPPFPDVLNTLSTLKSRFTTACLSNTNALHWSRLHSLMDLSKCFHHHFASHEIHAAKPEAQSFQIPLKRMGARAEHVWFFDDTLVNLEAARENGLTAFHVDRRQGVLPVLRELGLIG